MYCLSFLIFKVGKVRNFQNKKNISLMNVAIKKCNVTNFGYQNKFIAIPPI